jgi:hypothetical protein
MSFIGVTVQTLERTVTTTSFVIVCDVLSGFRRDVGEICALIGYSPQRLVVLPGGAA